MPISLGFWGGDAHITRVLGMGMLILLGFWEWGCPYHGDCDSAIPKFVPKYWDERRHGTISFVEEVAAGYSAYSSLFMSVAFSLHLRYVHSFISDSC